MRRFIIKRGQSQSRISAGNKTAVVLVSNYKCHKVFLWTWV